MPKKQTGYQGTRHILSDKEIAMGEIASALSSLEASYDLHKNPNIYKIIIHIRNMMFSMNIPTIEERYNAADN